MKNVREFKERVVRDSEVRLGRSDGLWRRVGGFGIKILWFEELGRLEMAWAMHTSISWRLETRFAKAVRGWLNEDTSICHHFYTQSSRG